MKNRWVVEWIEKKYENIAGWLDRQEKYKDGWKDRKNVWIEKKQMDGWIKQIYGWLEGKQKYEKIDGWREKNRWMAGWIETNR